MRLFVGVPVSENVKEKIKPLVDELKKVGVDLNAVPIRNMHFTLKFLGEVSGDKVREIKEKLSGVVKDFNKFEIKLEKVGVFPSLERIKVIWIGISDRKLLGLMKKVDEELNYIRKNEQEEIPHLTIARVKTGRNKGKLQEFLKKVKNESFGEMIVDKLVLYKSELTLDGPVYSVLEEFHLR